MENTVFYLSSFCYVGFSAYCTFENKSNQTCDYQTNRIENDHENCSHLYICVYIYIDGILMISGKRMQCCKVRRISRAKQTNFAHHVLVLFYPIIDEKALILGFSPLYQNI